MNYYDINGGWVETSPLVFCYGIIYVHQPPAKHFLFCRVSKMVHENGRKPGKNGIACSKNWMNMDEL